MTEKEHSEHVAEKGLHELLSHLRGEKSAKEKERESELEALRDEKRKHSEANDKKKASKERKEKNKRRAEQKEREKKRVELVEEAFHAKPKRYEEIRQVLKDEHKFDIPHKGSKAKGKASGSKSSHVSRSSRTRTETVKGTLSSSTIPRKKRASSVDAQPSRASSRTRFNPFVEDDFGRETPLAGDGGNNWHYNQSYVAPPPDEPAATQYDTTTIAPDEFTYSTANRLPKGNIVYGGLGDQIDYDRPQGPDGHIYHTMDFERLGEGPIVPVPNQDQFFNPVRSDYGPTRISFPQAIVRGWATRRAEIAPIRFRMNVQPGASLLPKPSSLTQQVVSNLPPIREPNPFPTDYAKVFTFSDAFKDPADAIVADVRRYQDWVVPYYSSDTFFTIDMTNFKSQAMDMVTVPVMTKMKMLWLRDATRQIVPDQPLYNAVGGIAVDNYMNPLYFNDFLAIGTTRPRNGLDATKMEVFDFRSQRVTKSFQQQRAFREMSGLYNNKFFVSNRVTAGIASYPGGTSQVGRLRIPAAGSGIFQYPPVSAQFDHQETSINTREVQNAVPLVFQLLPPTTAAAAKTTGLDTHQYGFHMTAGWYETAFWRRQPGSNAGSAAISNLNPGTWTDLMILNVAPWRAHLEMEITMMEMSVKNFTAVFGFPPSGTAGIPIVRRLLEARVRSGIQNVVGITQDPAVLPFAGGIGVADVPPGHEILSVDGYNHMLLDKSGGDLHCDHGDMNYHETVMHMGNIIDVPDESETYYPPGAATIEGDAEVIPGEDNLEY